MQAHPRARGAAEVGDSSQVKLILSAPLDQSGRKSADVPLRMTQLTYTREAQ